MRHSTMHCNASEYQVWPQWSRECVGYPFEFLVSFKIHMALEARHAYRTIRVGNDPTFQTHREAWHDRYRHWSSYRLFLTSCCKTCWKKRTYLRIRIRPRE